MRTGGCLCGALRYEVEGEPLLVVHCYCEDCRRESGSDHLTQFCATSAAVRVSGEPKLYVKPHPNGPIHRFFCADCGTTLFARPAATPERCNIRMGTMDDVSGLKPTLAIFCSRARAWTHIDPEVKQLAER